MSFDSIKHGVSYIVRFPMKFLKKIFLKRKDNKKTIDMGLQPKRTVFIPSPVFWGNIVVDFNAALFSKPCDLQIETAIINEDDNVWFIRKYVFLTLTNVAFDFACVGN